MYIVLHSFGSLKYLKISCTCTHVNKNVCINIFLVELSYTKVRDHPNIFAIRINDTKCFFGISWCRFLLNALRNSAKFLRWFKWKLIGYGHGEHCLAVEMGNFHHLSSGFKIYFSHLNRKTISDPLPNITSVLVKFCFAIFWIVLGHHWNTHATYSSGKLSYKIAKYQEQCQRQNYK